MKISYFTPDVFSGLLARARQGCRKAMDALLAPFWKPLRDEAAHRIPPRLKARCWPSDVCQTAMFHAFQGFADFRGATVEEFEAWLRKIMQCEIARQTRDFETQKRQVSREKPFICSDEEDGAFAEFIDTDALQPDAELLLEERAAVARFAVSLLESPVREVIQWHFIEEISSEEIAERLGCTVQQVQSKERIGLWKLRGVLEATDCEAT